MKDRILDSIFMFLMTNWILFPVLYAFRFILSVINREKADANMWIIVVICELSLVYVILKTSNVPA